MSVPRIAIDARLRAYRSAGIASHVECLLDGLQQLRLDEPFVVLLHRRDRSSVPVSPVDRSSGPLSSTDCGRGAVFSADPGRRPVSSPALSGTAIGQRRLWTPPHHRWEDWLLPLELASHRIHLFHATDFVVPRGWRGAAVATVHDLAFLRHPEFVTPSSARYYAGVHHTVHRAQRIIAVSEHTRRELLALTDIPADRIRVVPNALRPAFRAPADPDAEAAVVAGRGVREPFLLFVSTVEPRKNVVTLLDAFRSLLDEGRQLDLVLIGADGWNSRLVYERAQQLALADRAHFLGFVPDAELVAFYRRAAVLAHPAHDEGFGFAPLEAMASGTPVVVADAGALPEVVSQAGLQVPATEPGAWATALARLLDDRQLAVSLAAAGRERAAHFSSRRMAERTVAVYREAWAVAGHSSRETAKDAESTTGGNDGP